MTIPRKILVIGGEGFIGSALVKRLTEKGDKVFSLDNHLSSGHRERCSSATYITDDSTSILKINEQFDCVVHLGEYARMEQSLTQPDLCLQNNFGPLADILEYCRTRNVKLVYSGSSTKFMENPMDYETPYSFTKRINTELIEFYGKWYKIVYAICYFYNVYGPGEIEEGKYSTFIGKCVRAMQCNESIKVHGSGDQLRNFTHIDDTIDALLLIMENGTGDGYCISASEAVKVIDVVTRFGLQCEHLPDPAGNRKFSFSESEKIKSLGWSQKHKLFDYIDEMKINVK